MDPKMPLAASETLLAYLDNNFIASSEKLNLLNDEEIHVDCFWDEFLLENKPDEYFQKLKLCFPQLNFSINSISCIQQSYKNAVLKGDFSNLKLNSNNLQLKFPEKISFEFYKSFSGNIPVISVEDDYDFIKIIQALAYKNMPQEIPGSMGAMLLSGINNWEKIHKLQQYHETSEQYSKSSILSFPYLYKERLIILSSKPYSNVPSYDINVDDTKWKEISRQIRLHHECTHLYTIKKFGCASNNLHDEIIADYIGILLAHGYYDKTWALKFLGLENYPKYRSGGRLENYIDNKKLTSTDFNILMEVTIKAIENIQIFDSYIKFPTSDLEITNIIDALCQTSLISMASENGSNILLQKFCAENNLHHF